MRKVVVAFIALMCFGVASAFARPAPVRYTLDAPAFVVAQDVANAWSKNTGVAVALGSCSGARCIHVTVETRTCAIDSQAFGCTSLNADGSYKVTVSTAVMDFYGRTTQFNVLGHEVGHGIVHSLGGGYWHNPDSRSLLYTPIYPYDRPKQVIKSDRDLIASLIRR